MGPNMTEQDETPARNDEDALASKGQTEPNESESDAGAATPAPHPGEGNGRLRQLLRAKRAAETVAANTAAHAAELRQQAQSPARPGDYRSSEDCTRAIAEQAAREVGAEILARQANQAQELAARAAHEAWLEFDSILPPEGAGFR